MLPEIGKKWPGSSNSQLQSPADTIHIKSQVPVMI